MEILNQRRITVYPWLFLVTFWVIVAVNVVFHRGWEGFIGQLIGYDFQIFYSGGELYRREINLLYDAPSLTNLRQAIIQPAPVDENIFLHPPYVGLLFSGLSVLSPVIAFIVWTAFSILAVFAAGWLIASYLAPDYLKKAGFTRLQFMVTLFSFFPLVFGLHTGQIHAFLLLLLTGMVLLSIRGKQFACGALTAALMIKPPFALPFLLLWLVWKKTRALAAFCLVFALWNLPVLIEHGLQPYQAYSNQISKVLDYPYFEVAGLEITPYALLASATPYDLKPFWVRFTSILTVSLIILLAWTAYQTREHSDSSRWPAYNLALIFPLLASPHVLFYDMVPLVLFFVFWAHTSRSRHLLVAAAVCYLGGFLLPLATHQLRISLLGLLPAGLFLAYLRHLYRFQPWIFRKRLD